MGAWIETPDRWQGELSALSLPAWGRGLKQAMGAVCPCGLDVAPRVGAWIETPDRWQGELSALSLPAWGRGLKPSGGNASISIQGRSPRGGVD